MFLVLLLYFRELDHAMLRRLEKRILVDLPNFDARRRMFENLLPPKQKPSKTGVPQLTAQIDYSHMAEVGHRTILRKNCFL